VESLIIGVHPVYRRHGIGLALVNEFKRLAKDMRKVEKVFTLVDPKKSRPPTFLPALVSPEASLFTWNRFDADMSNKVENEDNLPARNLDSGRLFS
jgi:GNAT superfamily N-acetyltransferase